MKRSIRGWRLGSWLHSSRLLSWRSARSGTVGARRGVTVGVLVSGTTDTVTNIDPAGNYDFGTFTLDINFIEHLYDAKNGPKLVPSLATGCAACANPRTWRCTLRRGVKFHDGSDFDSADVKHSFDRVSNPGS